MYRRRQGPRLEAPARRQVTACGLRRAGPDALCVRFAADFLQYVDEHRKATTIVVSLVFDIRVGIDAQNDLRRFAMFVQRRIVAAIRRELVHDALRDKKPRKRLAPDPESGILASVSVWQLRVGDYRVFYDVDSKAGVVMIQRVVKKGRRTTKESLR